MNLRPVPACLLFLLLASLLAGCSTSPTDPRAIAKRRAERAAAYAALPDEQRPLVDAGQIQVGMGEDAVYIAWGAPGQVLRSGDASGERTTWLYHGTTTDEYVYWRYREVPRRDGTVFLERFMDRDYAFREYVSAELVFEGGRLARWRMLPRPPGNTVVSPQPWPY